MNAVCHYLQPGICQAVPWDPGPLIYYSWSMTWDPSGHHVRVSFPLKLGSVCNTGLYERLRIQRGISFSPLDQRIFNSRISRSPELKNRLRSRKSQFSSVSFSMIWFIHWKYLCCRWYRMVFFLTLLSLFNGYKRSRKTFLLAFIL